MFIIILLSFILSSCGTENENVSGVVVTPTTEDKEIDKKFTELEPDLDADGKIHVKVPKGNFLVKASKLKKEKNHPLLQYFSMQVYENTVDENSEFILYEDEDISSRFLGFEGAIDGKGALVPVTKIGPAITIKHEGELRQGSIYLHIPYDKKEDNDEWRSNSAPDVSKLALLHMVGSTVELVSVENGVDRKEDYTLAIGREQLGTFQVVKYVGYIFWTEAKVDLSKPQEQKVFKNVESLPRPELPEFDLLGMLATSNKSWKTSCTQNNDTSSYSELTVTKATIETSSFTFNSIDCSGELKFKEVIINAVTILSQTSNSIKMTTKQTSLSMTYYATSGIENYYDGSLTLGVARSIPINGNDVAATLSLVVSGIVIASDNFAKVYMESP
jgi:hypothetical protein